MGNDTSLFYGAGSALLVRNVYFVDQEQIKVSYFIAANTAIITAH